MCPNEKVCGKKPPRLRDGSEFVLVCRCVIWRHLICIQSGLDRPQVAQHLSGENGYPHLPVWFCCCQLITRPFSPDWKATFNWLGTIGRCYAVKWDFSSSWNQKYFFFPKRFQRTECVPGPPGGTRRRSPSSSDTKFGILMKFFSSSTSLFLVRQFFNERIAWIPFTCWSRWWSFMFIAPFGRPSVLYSNELFTVSCRLAVNIAILPPNFSSFDAGEKIFRRFLRRAHPPTTIFHFYGTTVGSRWNVCLHRSNSKWFHSN